MYGAVLSESPVRWSVAYKFIVSFIFIMSAVIMSVFVSYTAR